MRFPVPQFHITDDRGHRLPVRRPLGEAAADFTVLPLFTGRRPVPVMAGLISMLLLAAMLLFAAVRDAAGVQAREFGFIGGLFMLLAAAAWWKWSVNRYGSQYRARKLCDGLCPACSYPLPTETPREGLTPCPECGASWKRTQT